MRSAKASSPAPVILKRVLQMWQTGLNHERLLAGDAYETASWLGGSRKYLMRLHMLMPCISHGPEMSLQCGALTSRMHSVAVTSGGHGPCIVCVVQAAVHVGHL